MHNAHTTARAWVVFAPDGTVRGADADCPLKPVQLLPWHRITRRDRVALLHAIARDIQQGGACRATANGWRVERMALTPLPESR